MSFLLLKMLHLIGMVCWFAGLFYLPRLFVYHAMSDDQVSQERFSLMERKLYRGIMTPALWVTLLCGAGMLYQQPAYLQSLWMQLKLAGVATLVLYHFYCGAVVTQFAQQKNQHSHVYYRWINEIPVIFLIAIIALAVFKP